jgi:hypothetical protein
MSLPMTEDIQKIMALAEDKVSINNAPMPEEEMGQKNSRTDREDEDLTLNLEMIEPQEQKIEGTTPGDGPALSVSASLPEKEENKKNLGDLMNAELSAGQRREMFQEGRFDVSIFEEASKLLEEISKEPVKREKEEPPPIPWIQDFRDAVEKYYQKNRDSFYSWFNSCRHLEGWDHPYGSALTILTHARFNQKTNLKRLLKIPKRFSLLHQSNLSLEQIPPLEGTPFFAGENWRSSSSGLFQNYNR